MRIPLADGEVDLEARAVLRGGERIELTPREVELLRYLAAHPGVVPLRDVLTRVWGYSAGARTQAVHVAVRRLRAKIEADPGQPAHLLTVAGVGWRLVPATVAASPAAAPGELVGRDELLKTARDRVAERPLVTLLGPGGIGKTRLARALLELQPGRLVDLTAARTIADVRDAVLEGRDPLCLAEQLVVLDNVEQVAEVCAELCASWLRDVPDARLLLTSRVPLRLVAEEIVRVGPLDAPDAITLFTRRAGAAGVDVAGDPAVPALVQALEGNPLALELAAARTPLLPPARLLERGIGFLRARERDRPARHASLDDVVAWSYALLAPEEQLALRQLAAFVGGFGLDGAEAVVRVPGLDPLDAVHALLDASLLRELRPGRFAPWVAVSAFVERQGGAPDDAIGRHLDHYTAIGAAERRGEGLETTDLLDEAANLRAALARALERREDHRLADLCVGVGEAAGYVVHGDAARLIGEARERIGAEDQPAAAYGHARALSHVDPVAGARAAGVASQATGELGWLARVLQIEQLRDAARYAEALEAATQAVRVARNPRERIDALVHRAMAADRLGDAASAVADLDEAAALTPEVGPSTRALLLGTRGLLRSRNQAWEGAEADMSEALRLYVACGDVVNEGLMHANLASVHHHQRRLAEAAAAAERALACLRAVGWEARTASPLMVLGNVLRAEGRLEEAERVLGEAATVARRTGNRTAHAMAQCHLAQVLREQGRLDEALRVVSAGIATLEQVGSRGQLVELLTLRGELALDRGDLQAALSALASAEAAAEGLGPQANARRTIEWLRSRLASEA